MLTVITGPMFSGKSSKLISLCMSHAIAGKFVMTFKPDNDTRYDPELTKIVAHNGYSFPTIAISKECPELAYASISNVNERPDVLAFDESQFFLSLLFSNMIHDLLDKNFDIIVSGLSQDSFGNPFGAMPSLLAKADDIICLKAVCSKCKKISAATRTFRKIDSTEQVVVGGVENYEPRCYGCWKNG